MLRLNVTAPAKINVSLDITGSRPDGFHLLSTVMQSLSLSDRVTVSVSESDCSDIKLVCDNHQVPCDLSNTAYRAAALFLQKAKMNAQVQIEILKRIPIAAGLAGGSADAAAVLFALNHLYPGKFKMQTLMDLAIQIGADVPFCLHGGTVLCEGIGEKLKPLSSFADIPLLLLHPGFSVSTEWVFKAYDQMQLKQAHRRKIDTSQVIKAMMEHNLGKLALVTGNILEDVTISEYPQLQTLKDLLKKAGSPVVMMSGSGPVLYAMFSNETEREAAKTTLEKILPDTARLILAETRDSGPVIIR